MAAHGRSITLPQLLRAEAVPDNLLSVRSEKSFNARFNEMMKRRKVSVDNLTAAVV